MTTQRIISPAEKRLNELTRKRRPPSVDPFAQPEDDFTQAAQPNPLPSRLPSRTAPQQERGGFDLSDTLSGAVGGAVDRLKEFGEQGSAPIREGIGRAAGAVKDFFIPEGQGVLETVGQGAAQTSAGFFEAGKKKPETPIEFVDPRRPVVSTLEDWSTGIRTSIGGLAVLFGGHDDPDAGETSLFSKEYLAGGFTSGGSFSLNKWREQLVGEASVNRRKAAVAAYLMPTELELSGELEFDNNGRLAAATDELNLYKHELGTLEVIFAIDNFIPFGKIAHLGKVDDFAKGVSKLVGMVPADQLPKVVDDIARNIPVVAGGSGTGPDDALDAITRAVTDKVDEVAQRLKATRIAQAAELEKAGDATAARRIRAQIAAADKTEAAKAAAPAPVADVPEAAAAPQVLLGEELTSKIDDIWDGDVIADRLQKYKPKSRADANRQFRASEKRVNTAEARLGDLDADSAAASKIKSAVDEEIDLQSVLVKISDELDAPPVAAQATPPPAATVDVTPRVPALGARLPSELAGAKPNYGLGARGSFSLTFDSDLDKALYIVAQTKKSKSDAAYMKWIQDVTGLSVTDARQAGAGVRARIRSLAQSAPSTTDTLRVPAGDSTPVAARGADAVDELLELGYRPTSIIPEQGTATVFKQDTPLERLVELNQEQIARLQEAMGAKPLDEVAEAAAPAPSKPRTGSRTVTEVTDRKTGRTTRKVTKTGALADEAVTPKPRGDYSPGQIPLEDVPDDWVLGTGQTLEAGQELTRRTAARAGGRGAQPPGGQPPAPPAGGPPPAVPSPDDFAANIRLDKFGDAAGEMMKDWVSKNPDEVARATRGIRSDPATLEAAQQMLAEDMGADFRKLLKRWKPGDAWNAEEVTALRGALEDKATEVYRLNARIRSLGGNTASNKAELVLAVMEHAHLQEVAHGVTAEAGRTLRIFRNDVEEALRLNKSGEVFDTLLEKLGFLRKDQDKFERAVEFLGKLDTANPAAVNTFLRYLSKPNWINYVTEFWINSILSGPTTHLINMLTNASNSVFSLGETLATVPIEQLLAKIKGRPAERFWREVPEEAFGLWQGLGEGVRAAAYTMKNGVSPLTLGRTELRTRAFANSLKEVTDKVTGEVTLQPMALWRKIVNKSISAPTTALEAADAFFYSINYRAALNKFALRQARKEGLSGDSLIARVVDLKSNPSVQMVKNARGSAEYRLFRADPGAFANWLMRGRERLPLLRVIMPFVRTPMNLVKFGLERSPAFILNPRLYRELAAKSPEAADRLARGMIGSLIFAGIYSQFDRDRITGPAPKSRNERDRFYREGKLPYAIRIGNTWVQYQRWEPFNQVLGMAAAAHSAGAQEGDEGSEFMGLSSDGMVRASASILEGFVSQTFMSGVSDTLNAASEPERYFGNYYRRLVSSFLPFSSLMRQVGQVEGFTSEFPFTEAGGFKRPEGLVETIQANVPLINRNLPNSLDATGQEAQRPGIVWFPIKFNKAQQTVIDAELEKHGIELPFAGDSLDNQKLSREWQHEYQRLLGTAFRESLLWVVEHPGYDRRTEMQQADWIQDVIRNQRESIRDTVIQQIRQGRQPAGVGGAELRNSADRRRSTPGQNTAPNQQPTNTPGLHNLQNLRQFTPSSR